jgi:hypothetical protein
MAVTTFTLPYVNTPPYFSGSSVSTLVPNVFPVAIDGRPYMVDQKSGRFGRTYEQRVRDSTDDSTSPGEGAINPGGLWRRGQDSWHFGAGQQYADTAEAKDYQFYKSKGIDVWTKGQVSLLNATKLSLSNASTSQHMVVQDTRVYVAVGADVKFATDPYASSPTWTDCTGEPGGSVQAMATDGNDIYLAFPSDGIRKIDTSAAVGTISGTKFVNTTDNYYVVGFAKNYMFGAYNHVLRLISTGSPVVLTAAITPDDTTFTWVGVATGQNAVYAAGFSGKKSLIYKITSKTDGTLDAGVVALELPTGEIVSSISGYLGFILIGTNKGVRYCSTDAQSNLVAGPIIPTSGSVYGFTAEDKYAWFTWSNYDGVSTGLGRLDLSTFVAPNQPAFATDLMYTSTNNVLSLVSFNSKRLFCVSGIGVIAEDSSALVASGEIETGTYRWGIPDRKFVAKVDTRATPLVGSITQYLNIDDSGYTQLNTWSSVGDTENTVNGSDTHAIEASFKFALARDATVTSTGPTLTRWMSRAYVAPFRSQQFVVPILLHNTIRVRDKEYFYDVEEHQTFFDGLIEAPRIIVLQIGAFSHSVIVDDLEWIPSDATGNYWSFEGTLIVTLRSVEN